MAPLALFCLCITGAAFMTVGAEDECRDIDTSACMLLEKSQPSLCSDAHLAENVCKSYCGNCPVKCYDCQNPVLDPSSCVANATCSTGQVCSIRELMSYDGRHEYTMGCISKSICDGSGLTVSFGRRNLKKKDISIHCCNKDYCNGVAMTTVPPTTKTTAPTCNYQKILFVIDQTDGATSESYKQIVTGVVTALDVEHSRGVQVGVASFDNDLNVKLQLHTGETTMEIVHAIDKIHTETDKPDLGDTFHDLSLLLHHDPSIDVVIILSDKLNNDLRHQASHSLQDIIRHNPVRIVHGHFSPGDQTLDQYIGSTIHLGGSTLQNDVVKLIHAIC